jgi:hypothetical protein
MVRAVSGAYEKIKGGEYGEEVKELCYRLMDRVYCRIIICFVFSYRYIDFSIVLICYFLFFSFKGCIKSTSSHGSD